MRTQEAEIYRDIQKSTDKMLKTLDTLGEKVYDSGLAAQVSKQALNFSLIQNEASKHLVEAMAEQYRSTYFEDAVLKGGLEAHTLLNTSTGHIAEVLIENTTKGILDMEKTLRHHPEAGESATALARNLMDLEEKNIAQLKTYL